jgi:streptogramin lyase
MADHSISRCIQRSLLAAAVGGGLIFSAAPPPAAADAPTGPQLRLSLDSSARPTSIIRSDLAHFSISIPNQNQLTLVDAGNISNSYPLLTTSAKPFDQTVGPDLAVWISEQNAGKIARFDGSAYQEFTLPYSPAAPTQIVTGQDGRIWYTDFSNNKIGWLTPAGQQQTVTLPGSNSRPLGIAVDLTGNIWFTEWNRNTIGQISTDGSLQEYALPAAVVHPAELTLDADGMLWFTSENSTRIGCFNPVTHAVTVYSLATSSSAVSDMSMGADGRMYFIGFQTVGSFAITESGPADLIEYPNLQTVFEAEGRTQITSGSNENMLYISGSGEKVFELATQAYAQRDLQLFNDGPYPSVYLVSGPLDLKFIARNWSTQSAVNASLLVDLPVGVAYLSSEGTSSDCSLAGRQLTCPLGDLPAQSDANITLHLQSNGREMANTQNAFVSSITSDETDYAPANNRVVLNFGWKKTFDYNNDFSTSDNSGWSPNVRVNADADNPRLGNFDNTQVIFGWNHLPMHDRVTVCYDLFITGSWDGEQISNPANPAEIIGPDIWTNYINGTPIITTTFSNQPALPQSFPATYLAGSNPAGTGAVWGDFNGSGQPDATRYSICRVLPHTETDLQLVFYAAGLDESGTETWSIDNVHLSIYYRSALDYLYLPLTQASQGD